MYLSGPIHFSTKLIVLGIVVGLFGLVSSESWSPPDETLLQHRFLSKFRPKGISDYQILFSKKIKETIIF